MNPFEHAPKQLTDARWRGLFFVGLVGLLTLSLVACAPEPADSPAQAPPAEEAAGETTATPVQRAQAAAQSESQPTLPAPTTSVPEVETATLEPTSTEPAPTPTSLPSSPTEAPAPPPASDSAGQAAQAPAGGRGPGGRIPPRRLIIPRLGVDAPVESVGMTAQGAMGSPSGWMNVAWFRLGVSPGQYGNAVMAGHVDDASGRPAVFARLGELQPGDEIRVVGGDGHEYVFRVTRVQVYPRQEVPMQEVFGMAPARNLNLTTCYGTWDRGKGTYDHRLIVFSTLAEVR